MRVCLFGAPLDTGNLGVSALGLATMAEVVRRLPEVEISLFDHGRGIRPLDLRIEGKELRGCRRGAWISRRLYRGESLWSMLAASHVAPRLNANVREMDRASAVLDVSGGDSFTDLYGREQLDLVTLPKRIALQRHRPLILLPQTYGPFRETSSVLRARDILAAADQAWTRDEASFDRLHELLGPRFDPRRHRSGVDVAFALPSTDPGARLGSLSKWLANGPPVVGLNVSGLLSVDAEGAKRRFGLSVDYVAAMEGIARRLLARSDRRLLLVPHVQGGGAESDEDASRELAARLEEPERIACLPTGLGADEIKHVIAGLEWFLGARMHSTIAALSSRTPVAAVAYSDKFQGVFDSCGLGHRVLDARHLSTSELVDAAVASWDERENDAAVLRQRLPAVEAQVARQFDEVVSLIAPASTSALRPSE
jgi:colanic acid/amylovoran biosynthesis protein